MRSAVVLALVLGILATLPPPADAEGGATRKEIPKVFKAIEKSWKAGKVAEIAALLPPKGKVKLALLGVKSDWYRREQAHALLEKYFGSIETKEFKLDETPKGSSARFKHVFKVKADRRKEEHLTFITLDREEDRWVIVEIIED